MCTALIFIDPVPQPGRHRLILAMNRDEFFDRETLPVSWRGDILAGWDLQAGREGGTWLAIARDGRIGMLTNIFGRHDPTGHGRGCIIPEFLTIPITTNASNDAFDFASSIASDPNRIFNPFNLCLLSPNGLPDAPPDARAAYHMTYLCKSIKGHVVDSEDPTEYLCGGGFAVSNSPMSKPYVKACHGQCQITSLGQSELNHVDKQAEMMDVLHDILSRGRDDAMPPGKIDPQILLQAPAEVDHPLNPHLECLGSLFVTIPPLGYGTRMQTIILIDYDNKVTVSERTRVCTTSQAGDDIWSAPVRHSFKIQ